MIDNDDDDDFFEEECTEEETELYVSSGVLLQGLLATFPIFFLVKAYPIC